MAENLGTAALYLTVNTEGMDAGITKAKRSTQDFGKSHEESSKRSEQATKRQIDALNRQIATLGKSRDEVIRWRIEQQTSGKVADDLKKKLDAQVASLRRGGVEFSKYGLSAKQQAAALRGVPAQITDIFTALGSGQRPLTVLLQQGGQLKDMFGGVVPAVRALGSSLLGLINPYTVAAGAAAGLGLAWFQATERGVEFNKALILTGNSALTSADALAEMASRLDSATNSTAGRASEVLAQVAATGRFTAEQIDMVAEAALRMEDATGKAVEETIKEFVALRNDPVDAILKLNESQNFLAEETLRTIQALRKQGREAEAAAVAMRAYADTINDRAPQIIENLGLFSSAWRSVKTESKGAWDTVVNGFERADKAAKEGLVSLGQYIQAFRSGPAGAFSLSGMLAPPVPVTSPASKSGGRTVSTEQAKAAIEFDKEGLRFATERQRMERDIAEARALGLKAGKSQVEVEKRIAEIRASYARKDKSGKGVEGATNRAALQEFQDALKREQGALANSTQILQAQYSARLITVEKYYAEQKRLAESGAAAEVQAIEGQISVLRARNVTGKESIDNLRQLGQLEAELAKVRADGATRLAVLNIQEADALKQRRLAAEAYKSALDERGKALSSDMDAMVARIGMGEREFEIQSRINEVYEQQAKELLELARLRSAGDIDEDTFKEREAQLRDSTEKEVDIVRSGYDRMAEAQANWANGARKAYEDIKNEAADVAGFTYNIFRDAFDGLSDVITDFLTTGKSDWKGFFDDLGRQITKFIVNQQLTSWMESIGKQSQAGGGGGGWLQFLGSLFWNGAGGPGYAKGGAFAGGSEIAFANGGVVSSPTRFPMSAGRIGLMGEAGPEAIMPLERGRDGRLGVRMHGDGGSNTFAPVLNQTFVVQGAPDNRTREQMSRASGREAARGIARTGR